MANFAKETKPDCCDHAFCYTCMKLWLDQNRRKKECPLCRRTIATITFKDENGAEAIEQISEAEPESDEEYGEETIFCHQCMEDIDIENEDLNLTTTICWGFPSRENPGCLHENVTHIRCMNNCQKLIWDLQKKYFCKICCEVYVAFKVKADN